MAVIEMSVQDWIDVKDNPRQRNTERRANLAKTKHLSKYEAPHRFVFAAIRNGDVLCKLDGHTRAMLWSLGELELPPDGKVTVCLIEVSSYADAKHYYDCLDAGAATKQPCDTVFGATRENKFRLRSSLLRSCTFTTQLKIADSGKKFSGDINALVKKWKPILLSLDSLGLGSGFTVLISAMLLSIKRDGVEVAGPFWKGLDQDSGTKTAAGMDGIEALRRHIENRRAEKRVSGYDNLIDIVSRSLTAYSAWKDGRRIKTLRTSDLTSWLPSSAKKSQQQQTTRK